MEKLNDKIYNYIKENKLDIEKVMQKYNKYIFTIIKNAKFTLSKEDEEEIILDTYLTLWNNQSKLDINKDISPYIAGITRNLLLKKCRKFNISENIEDYQENIESVQNIELEYIEGIRNNAILEELEKLKQEDRDIFISYYYEEKKIKELSIIYGMSESKIKSKLFRIRKKLKKSLKEGGYEGC